ncbi:MAG: methyltransferase [Candidatus Buchananbacteria bacterium]
MSLNQEQQSQIDFQLENHKHSRYEVDIVLTDGKVLKNFTILPDVFRSDKMPALFLAKWLFFNNGLYKDKRVLDLGCGSGIQGIVCAFYGASKVVFSDIAIESAQNTKINIKKYGLDEISKIYQGDLFEKINERFDIIIFNQPPFPIEPIVDIRVSVSMLGGVELIKRFFKEVSGYLNKGGIIIMPYVHIAGPENDPYLRAPEFGYNVEKVFEMDIETHFKKGLMTICKIWK